MKIAVVNTSLTQGGAARAAKILHDLYNTSSEIEKSVFFHGQSAEDSDLEISLKRPATRQINALLSRLGGAELVFDFGFSDSFAELTDDFDILHIHNIHGYYLNFSRLLEAWGTRRPIFWTWHDMWGATGRCGFSYECDGWQSGCKTCPNLGYYPAAWFDFSDREFKLKEKLLITHPNIRVISPSNWLADIAMTRGFNRNLVHVIPNPFDFQPNHEESKYSQKQALEISTEAPFLLFVANDCSEERKGYSDFAEATRELGVTCVAIGKPPVKKQPHITHVGSIPLSALRVYYRAADVMVIPSYADNFPNTTIEAIASGTPVIGYSTGGLAEQLTAPHCVSIPTGDTEELKRSISEFVKEWPANGGLRTEKDLIGYAEDRWATKGILDKYLRLFKAATV